MRKQDRGRSTTRGGAQPDSSRLDFYEVDQAYVDELKSIEPKIPNIAYETHNKFVCGVLFDINGLEYFAPISSFKKGQKTNFIIKNSKGKPVGSIRFSFMFPVVASKRRVKDFSLEDDKRKALLMEELAFCNRHARRIHAKARHVYDTATSRGDAQMASVCCDFKKLEAHVRTLGE